MHGSIYQEYEGLGHWICGHNPFSDMLDLGIYCTTSKNGLNHISSTRQIKTLYTQWNRRWVSWEIHAGPMWDTSDTFNFNLEQPIVPRFVVCSHRDYSSKQRLYWSMVPPQFTQTFGVYWSGVDMPGVCVLMHISLLYNPKKDRRKRRNTSKYTENIIYTILKTLCYFCGGCNGDVCQSAKDLLFCSVSKSGHDGHDKDQTPTTWQYPVSHS